MPTYMQYILQTVFNFAMIFSLAYMVLLLMEWLKKRGRGHNEWIAGLCIGLILIMVNLVLKVYNFSGAPDGRFLLTAYSTFFYGAPAGIIVAIVAATTGYVINGLSFTQIFVTALLLVFVFIFLRSQRIKKKIDIHMGHILGGALIALVLSLPISLNIISNKMLLTKISVYVPFLSFIAMIVMVGLSVATLREIERTQNIEDLEANKLELTNQYMEIQALYEELTAVEETLRENYDELFIYKEKVEFYAFHDPKTGFYNRDYLIESVNQLKMKNKNFTAALIVVGIKHMAHYRGILGRTLIEVMEYCVGLEIKESFGALSASQIFALGDGRFAILIPELIQKDEIDQAAANMQQAMDKAIMIETLELTIQTAFGGVMIESNETLTEQCLEYAEIAFLVAVDQDFSKAIHWFEKTLYDKRTHKQKMEQHLRKAIELKEFYLVLQPQVNAELKTIGFEALIRWENSELGMVPPSEFIHLAEEMGYIDVIGRYVIESVCQKSVWLREEHHISSPISINVSFIELMSPHYVVYLMEIINSYALSHADICLEITESMISLVDEDVTLNIEALICNGFSLHLDDFGTGYSSLNHLGKFPVKVLKIDKSFVDVISTDQKMRILVELTIEYAHRLDIQVIAEGVETEEQVNILKELGCDSYQGYYYAKPMNDKALLLWLADSEAFHKNT